MNKSHADESSLVGFCWSLKSKIFYNIKKRDKELKQKTKRRKTKQQKDINFRGKRRQIV